MDTTRILLPRYPAGRRGAGSFVGDAFTWITNTAGSGAAGTGEISRGLLLAGYTVEEIRTMLNRVASQANATPLQLAAVTEELRFMNEGGGYAQRTNWWPLVLIGGLIWLASRER